MCVCFILHLPWEIARFSASISSFVEDQGRKYDDVSDPFEFSRAGKEEAGTWQLAIEVSWFFDCRRSERLRGPVCLFLILRVLGLAASDFSSDLSVDEGGCPTTGGTPASGRTSGMTVCSSASGKSFDLDGLPLVGIVASWKFSRSLAGLAFSQWWSWIFSAPDLKVPSLTLMVEWLGLSTILCTLYCTCTNSFPEQLMSPFGAI